MCVCISCWILTACVELPQNQLFLCKVKEKYCFSLFRSSTLNCKSRSKCWPTGRWRWAVSKRSFRGLLNREIKKRQARTKALVETLQQMSLKDIQINKIEGQWKSKCDALEESRVSNSTQLQVSCLRSSVYFTIISCWIPTACVGLLQNQGFYVK